MSLELPPEALWLTPTGAVGLVGWLLKRAITGIDNSLQTIRIDLKALDNTDRDQAKALLESQIQIKFLNEKIRQLEDELARVKERHEEFGRFLARMGFQRSSNEGPKGEGG